ncbi:nucleoside diphosphate kinase, partial [Dichotomocladium elegans]
MEEATSEDSSAESQPTAITTTTAFNAASKEKTESVPENQQLAAQPAEPIAASQVKVAAPAAEAIHAAADVDAAAAADLETDSPPQSVDTTSLLEKENTIISNNEELLEAQTQSSDTAADPVQRTLALIKPDAVEANAKNAIMQRIAEAGFLVVQDAELHLTKDQACLFYQEHEGKPFYAELTNWMSSAPIHALVLEKTNAIRDWRSLMGPTDPSKARELEPNSIRAQFGTNGMSNATHGSDCQASADREIDIIF